jgi:DNA polymerase sigma
MPGCTYTAAVAAWSSSSSSSVRPSPPALRDASSGLNPWSHTKPSSSSTDDDMTTVVVAVNDVETLVNELVASLRPTEAAERRRRAVFEHIKHLAQDCFGRDDTLVSAYGSVPLRAYLPDGDIDICLLGDHRVIDKSNWTTKFRKYIERAENESPEAHEFAVSEISVINADVKLMKCIVDGIMVDVSANQFGGLASLGFLEETNSYIGRDDLFVRSIILVKAWGFY